MAFNMSSIRTTSDGIWFGENPLQYAFPLLIMQTIFVILTSRVVAFFLKPLRQPNVVAEILGGIVLGPSALGRNKRYMGLIFPTWSTTILESVANVGLLFFIFLVGLELDVSSIRRIGKRAILIAIASISFPFLLGLGLSFILAKTLAESPHVPGVVFIGISLSITAFPVLARILAELKLLTTGVGEMAMAVAALNDVVAWVLLALAVALASGSKGTALTSIWVLASGLGCVLFMVFIVRPAMQLLVRRYASHDVVGGSSYVVITLAGVMLSGFMTDMIGIHAIFGAFVFGIIIPHHGEFEGKLRSGIEDFVSGLLLPLYFASNGLKTDVAKIKGGVAWGLLALVISTACAGKIIGTFVVAVWCTIPVRESLALGVLMNTKGLVELIVLNIGRDRKVLDDEMFTILVIMALFTTFITTPTVMAIYKPVHNNSDEKHQSSSKAETSDSNLRILACIRGQTELTSLASLVNSYTAAASVTKLYIMRLIELTDRSSSIVMARRTRKSGLPCIGRFRAGDFNEHLAAAFKAYHHQQQQYRGIVRVRTATSVSTLATMHEDICHVAEKKRAELVILPFHKQWKREEDDREDAEINLGQGWRGVNERVLREARCSVAVLVDRGFGLSPETGSSESHNMPVRRVCVVFLGGPDSREALRLVGRMADNPGMRITVIRYSSSVSAQATPIKSDHHGFEHQIHNMPVVSAAQRQEEELDEEAVLNFLRRWDETVRYVEKKTRNIIEELLTIGRSGEFELVMVGKGRFAQEIVASAQVEYQELGPIGGMLASSDCGIISSLLVIQQHDLALESRGNNWLNMFRGKGSAGKCVIES